MSSKLDPVQVVAIEFAADKPGVAWVMDKGLGKSLTALSEFKFLCDLGEVDRMIIIAPNSFRIGWLDEIEKHGFEFDAHLFRASKKDRAVEWMNKPRHELALPPVMIINYEAARLPAVMTGIVKWASIGKTYVVIDESIQIKGATTKQTRAVHALCAWGQITKHPINCRYIRLLTGRPQTQGPQDLWGQLRAIGLFQGVNFYTFRNNFCQMGGWENKEVVGAKNVEYLNDLMSPVVFRANKSDWLPLLPRKDYTIADYKMSGEQKRQYLQMEHHFLLEMQNQTVTVDVAIAKYEKLAQIQTGFIYSNSGEVIDLVRPEDNPRLLLLQRMLYEEIEGKAIIVYRHRAVFDMLLRALREYDCAWIRGYMTPEEVGEQKKRFNEDPHCRFMLAQIKAAKFGHTLIAGQGNDRCGTMIFFENSYSADDRDQIEDRIHRRGQTGQYVLYIDLSGSDLDRRIVRALQKKDALYKTVFKNLRVTVPEPLVSDMKVW